MITLKILADPDMLAMDVWAENSEPHFGHLSRFKIDIYAKSILTLFRGLYDPK